MNIEHFKNRHIKPLPIKSCKIEIIINDTDGIHIYLCNWLPFNPNHYIDKKGHIMHMPNEGYLGTAKIIKGKWKGIGYNVWEQNDLEFTLYNIV